MLFNTPSFIFILLPFSLIAALLIKKTEVRNTVLAAAGVVFYALGDLSALPVFLLSVLICYISGILLAKNSKDGSGDGSGDKSAEKGRRRNRDDRAIRYAVHGHGNASAGQLLRCAGNGA